MPGYKKTMTDFVRSLWSAIPDNAPSKPGGPEVVIHDPDAKLPHDLDDPFFDRRVQSRMADVISHAGKK